MQDTWTWDHGVPQSWYPAGSLPNVRKPKAPSCHACNQRLKLIEERVFFPMALGLDPADPASRGIREIAQRAINPSLAKSDADRRARQKRRDWLRGQTFVPSSTTGAIPGFERLYHGQPAARIAEVDLRRVAEKLFRVAFWSSDEGYVEPPYEVDVHVARSSRDVEVVAQIIKKGDATEIPPGVFVYLRRAEDDVRAGMVVVELWGRLRLFGSVMPKEQH